MMIPLSGFVRTAAAVVLTGVLLLFSGPARSGPLGGAGHVIPSGQEKLFLRMTDPGSSGFPGGWVLDGVSIKMVSAVANYRGPKGRRTSVELVHPQSTGSALDTTVNFALVAPAGSSNPPPGLIKALAGRIRQEEKGFAWVSQVRPAAVPPDRLNRARYRLDDKQRGLLERIRKLASKGHKGPASKMAMDMARRAGDPDPARAAAEVLRANGMPDEAVRTLGDMLKRLKLERDPSAHEARLELLASLDQAGSNRAAGVARAIAGDFPRLYPEAECARVAALQILLREGRTDTADRLTTWPEGDSPVRCVSLFRLKTAMAAGKDTTVDQVAKAVLDAFPDDQDALFLWGTYYYKKGADQKALHKAARIWDRLAGLNPRYPTFIGQYGTVYLVGGLLKQEATREIVVKARAQPENMVMAYLAGIGLYYQRRYHEVIPFLEKAAAAVPDDARAHMYLAMAHFFDGDPKTAETMLEALDSAAYQEPDIYYCRSLFYRGRNLPRAIEEMEKFLEVFEGENRLRFGQEKVEKAREDLRRMRLGEVPDVQLAIPDPLPPGQPYPQRRPADSQKDRK